jgi:hypothetical protein
MDFESELFWHLSALGRLAREAHQRATAAGQTRPAYVLDDTTQAVVNTFVTYELRQPADLIADAIEMYVMTKAAQGNSRAVMCLARYDVNQPPAGSS